MTDRAGLASRSDATLALSVADAATDPERASVAEGTDLLMLVDFPRLRRLLGTMLDETEFLSPYGLRSLSGYHRDHPFVLVPEDPAWRDELLFHEYFHGETGEGLGASHQTGWTALLAAMLAERELR